MLKRKIISSALALTFVCSSVITVFAENEHCNTSAETTTGEIELFSVFDGGSGTVENPYLVSTEEQLLLIHDFPDRSFKLIDDIELTDTWNYIGYSGDDFTGTLDGNGYTISNVTNIFADTNNETVKNLILSGSENLSMAITNNGMIDNCSIVGENIGFVDKNKGTILNSSINGNINRTSYYRKSDTETINTSYKSETSEAYVNSNGTTYTIYYHYDYYYKYFYYYDYTGGFANYNSGEIKGCNIVSNISLCDQRQKISQSSSSELVKSVGVDYYYNSYTPRVSDYFYSGGFIGYNDINGKIIECSINGLIDSSATYITTLRGGSFVGCNLGEIGKSYAISNISQISTLTVSTSCVGGFAYENIDGEIADCFTHSIITASALGLSSDNGDGAGFIYKNSGIINNCYAVGTITAKEQYPFCSLMYNNYQIKNCYYDKTVSGLTDTKYAAPKSTLAMSMQETYTDWDFDTVWALDANINDGYPYLLENPPATSENDDDTTKTEIGDVTISKNDDDKYILDLDISSNTEDATSGIIIVALYNSDNSISGVKLVESSDTQTDNNITIEIESTENAVKAKVMLWEDLKTIRPLCDYKEVDI